MRIHPIRPLLFKNEIMISNKYGMGDQDHLLQTVLTKDAAISEEED